MLSFLPAVILKTLRQIGRSELKKKWLVTSLAYGRRIVRSSIFGHKAALRTFRDWNFRAVRVRLGLRAITSRWPMAHSAHMTLFFNFLKAHLHLALHLLRLLYWKPSTIILFHLRQVACRRLYNYESLASINHGLGHSRRLALAPLPSVSLRASRCSLALVLVLLSAGWPEY